MRRVFDTFLFGDELDMLECRLVEAEDNPQVYRHVLVEAPVDHQGNPKPLYYADNRERFASWSDRIVHVIADIPGASAELNPWNREHAQRDHIWLGIADADPDDLVLLCDVDEIPSPAAYEIQPRSMAALNMRLAMFAVDWVCPEETRIATAALYKNLGGPLWYMRDNGPRGSFELFNHCGWHFTWLGGPEAIQRKASQFCHLELQRMIMEANQQGLLYSQGMTWHGQPGGYPPVSPEIRMLPAVIDETWPRYIRENRCPENWFRPTD